MLFRPAAAALALTALHLVAASDVRAAEDPGRFSVERFRPAVDRTGILDVESGTVVDPFEADVALWAGYAHEPLALYRRTPDNPGGGLERIGALVGPRVGANVVAVLGLTRWLELGVDVPVVLFQARGALPSDLPLTPIAAAGLGDVRLVPKFALLRADEFGVDLAVSPTVTVPSAIGVNGVRGDYLGDSFFTFAPEVMVSRTLFDIRFAGDVGYRARTLQKVGGVVVGHEGFYRVGMGLPLQSFNVPVPIELEASVNGAVTVLPEPGSNAPLEVLGGLRWDLGPFQLFAAAGAGVVGGPGVPDFRVQTGVRYLSDLVDKDGDGVDDGEDSCAELAEDKDGLDDQDGCPEADADKDGVLDENDRCPDQLEDPDGFEDADGCDDDDNDDDGVADASDRCPRQPGDPAFQGCRPPDADGDRVADHLDLCPTVAAPNTSAGRRDGCPVTGPAVEVTADRVEIGERFGFAIDSAVLLPSSTPLVENIAAVLIAHPEIQKVRIEGHTDDTGWHAYNVKLSLRRAVAVRDALIKRGVAPDRLEAKGLGAARPLVEGTSETARTENRRVELVVVHD